MKRKVPMTGLLLANAICDMWPSEGSLSSSTRDHIFSLGGLDGCLRTVLPKFPKPVGSTSQLRVKSTPQGGVARASVAPPLPDEVEHNQLLLFSATCGLMQRNNGHFPNTSWRALRVRNFACRRPTR